MCRKDELFYYDSLKCCDCQSRENLHANRYSERVLCLECINEKLNEAEVKTIQITVIENDIEG
jgi:hypothetical protein